MNVILLTGQSFCLSGALMIFGFLKATWTADMHLRDRVFIKEVFESYIPVE